MRIVYILKKGLSCYPPCLNQVLSLHDLGHEIVVYHGQDPTVNPILEAKGIEHHLLKSDRVSSNSLESAINLLRYNFEIKKIIKRIGDDCLLWFGNAESALMLRRSLKKKKYVLSVLELYDNLPFYRKRLKQIAKDALANVCCEPHRAQIMVAYYGLDSIPFVVPNKPYDLGEVCDIETLGLEEDTLTIIKNKNIVLYQGIISQDRPLIPVAEALADLQRDFYFCIMGKADKNFLESIRAIYPKTLHIPHIGAPNHLAITKFASIGIASYDFHILNNIFCAPNKIFEYAKYGVPMIVSNNISLQETVGSFGCGECIDLRDKEEIKASILKIINGRDRYSKNATAFYRSVDTLKEYQTVMKSVKERFEKCKR